MRLENSKHPSAEEGHLQSLPRLQGRHPDNYQEWDLVPENINI